MPVTHSGSIADATSFTDTHTNRFFESVHQKFQLAERIIGGSVDRFYKIGNYTIRLQFAGPTLVPAVTPAFEHLAVEPTSQPALTICIWDSVSTDTRMHVVPWSNDDYMTRGDVRGYTDDAIRTAFHHGSDTLHLLNLKKDLGIFWLNDAHLLPYYESGAPLQTILHWWLADHGHQLIHAGAIGTPKGGVVLAGKSESGKSTTALACLNTDLVYVSDDYCLLASEPDPYVHSLYSSGKLNPQDVYRFPHLKPAISNQDRFETEKALFFFNPFFPEKISSGFPLQAILLPKVTSSEKTTLSPVSRSVALKALAPSTIFQLSGAGRSAFQTIVKCVRQVPCYILELGSDISEIPETIQKLLSRN